MKDNIPYAETIIKNPTIPQSIFRFPSSFPSSLETNLNIPQRNNTIAKPNITAMIGFTTISTIAIITAGTLDIYKDYELIGRSIVGAAPSPSTSNDS